MMTSLEQEFYDEYLNFKNFSVGLIVLMLCQFIQRHAYESQFSGISVFGACIL